MMSQNILLSSLILIIFLPVNTKSQLITNSCENSTIYTTNSTFQTNLNLLLSSLTLNTRKTGFFNSTVGQVPDRVYGSALCRGDISPNDCTACLITASEDLPQLCPYNRGAIAWYDECMVRYSNKYFFSSLDTNGYIVSFPKNWSDPILLEREVAEMMESISRISVSTDRFFATGMVNLTGSDLVYGLVQCTSDLNRDQCLECLNISAKALANCCYGNIDAISLKASCILWYEEEKFFLSDPIWVAPLPHENPQPAKLSPPPTAVTEGRA